jgi:dTDP-4-amino-4,6-dideoxygalactose transaminase
MEIPLCDLTSQYAALKGEIDAAMQAVAGRGSYILGPNVAALEREVAEYCQCEFAVGVNSGTDALYLALLASGIGQGDEVITTQFTFIATTEAIQMVGATPVFVDIDPREFNIDVELIEEAITTRTKALLPVHLYGRPCNMDAIVEIAQERDLLIIEDCAQAIGATYRGRKVGSFGRAGCFSFFPSKNLGCMGDGGMITTNDRSIYERVELLRRHGGKIKYHHTECGVNSRLDELQAAILRVKLTYLDAWNTARRDAATRYEELLGDIHGVTTPNRRPHAREECLASVCHQYTILAEDRELLRASLTAAGIGSAIYYPIPLHLQVVHRSLGHREGAFPQAERVAGQCLSLPMFPELTSEQQIRIADCLRQATSKRPVALVA